MVSVATQTPWSWLRDARAAARLEARAKDIDRDNVENDCEKDQLPGAGCGEVEREGRRCVGGEEVEEKESGVHRSGTPPNTEGEGLLLPSLVHKTAVPTALLHSHGRAGHNELHLPHIVPPGSSGSDGESPSLQPASETEPATSQAEEQGETEDERLPLSHLPHITIPDSSSSDEGTSEEEGEEEGEEDEEGSAANKCEHPPPYPDLQVQQLSWPAVLQYLRESDSLASHHFSLDRQRNSEQSRGAPVGDGETSRRVATPVIGGTDRVCQFCGHPPPQWSILECATGEAEPVPEACCAQFKEYCVLVVTCLRQMVAERAEEGPAMISVHSKQQRATLKKTAEEKAFALMRRKRKWEELQRRRRERRNKTLQSSSFYSLTKQTKTIQFSLVSPAVLGTGWMVSAKDTKTGRRGGEQEKRKKRRSKGREETRPGALPADVLDMLKKSSPPPGQLEVRAYPSSGQVFSTILPDRTGQCYYPSGALAVLVSSHVPGSLSYLLFNDDGAHQMLCYADELGRAYCYHSDGSLSLHLTPSEGVLYGQRYSVRRRWQWRAVGRGTGSTPFQPIHLALNKYLSLQCSSQDQLVVHFSANQQHFKFIIPRKLKDDTVLENGLSHSVANTYRQQLTHIQSKLSHLLAALGGSRSRKLTDLQAIYGSKVTHPGKRPRSRSTGALNLRQALATPTGHTHW